ncbi:MAG: hypothetical protein R6V73_00560 [Anaerolineales bacterium]|jgi:hypothetical protein
MKNPTDRLIQRTQTYWYADGLAEIGFTIICLMLSAYFYGQAMLAPGSLLFRILDVGFLLILILGILISRKVVTILKTRLTYPRTGYVSYKQPKPSQRLGSIAIAIVTSAIIILVISFGSDNIGAYLPIVTGVLLGTILILFAYRSRVSRYYLLATISALLGSGLSLSGVGDMLGLSYYYGLMGLVVLISGLLVLRDYLIKTQPIEE